MFEKNWLNLITFTLILIDFAHDNFHFQIFSGSTTSNGSVFHLNYQKRLLEQDSGGYKHSIHLVSPFLGRFRGYDAIFLN